MESLGQKKQKKKPVLIQDQHGIKSDGLALVLFRTVEAKREQRSGSSF